MKKLYKTSAFSLLMIILSSTMFAQDINSISQSLNSASAKEISKMLDKNVEVSILNKDSYTKEEAEPLLASFFTTNTNISYKTIHKGKSLNNAYYQIGELTATDNIYRTYTYVENENGIYVIKEFRIERQ